MITETQTRTGRCATHGSVEASREIPRIQFPWVVFAVRRSLARRRPFRCPTCGDRVDADSDPGLAR
jgi:hypothetical protein